MTAPSAPARLRRAIHFVPGGNEKMLAKALTLPADSLILDLEDAVTAPRKDEVRQVVRGWLADVPFGRQERMVRINPLESPWGRADLDAIMQSPPDAIVLPKVRNIGDVEAIDRILLELEAQARVGPRSVRLLLVATETAEGVLNIATTPRHPRVDAINWGAEDLSAALGARRNRDDQGQYLEVFRYCRSMCLLAAVAAQVQPIDSVWVDIKDSAGLRADCASGAAMGFTGKITIHPSQIDIVNEYFTPSAAEVAAAQELLEAFAANEIAGRGAFAHNGEMVDMPHLTRARTVLERARHAGLHAGLGTLPDIGPGDRR